MPRYRGIAPSSSTTCRRIECGAGAESDLNPPEYARAYLHEVQLASRYRGPDACVVLEYFHDGDMMSEHRVPHQRLLFQIFRNPARR